MRVILRNQSHTSSNGATAGRALAAIKAHPIAAALAILTLALAIGAAAREPQHTPGRRTGVVTRATRPAGAVSSVPAMSVHWSAIHRWQPRRAARASTREQRRGAAAHETRSGPAQWPRAALSAARRFFSTYLPFTYAQLPARAIQFVAPTLRARIAGNPPGVPVAIRRMRPQVTALMIIPARIAGAGVGWAATATVSDRLESYHVTVTLGQQHGGWLVTSIVAP